MDCSALLKAQQQDFCHRLEIGNLLISRKSDLHSESCILAEEVIEKIRLESNVEAQNIVSNNLSDINAQDIFNLLFNRRLAIKAFLSQFGDLVLLDTSGNNQRESTFDRSLFRVKNNPKIKVLLKNYQGELKNIKLILSLKEVEKNDFIVFSFLSQTKKLDITQYQIVFLGFISSNSLVNKKIKKEINITNLSYIAGLSFYLKNGIEPNESLFISAKKYLKKGHYHRAVILFDQLITQGDVTEKNFFLRGICQYKLDNKKTALRDFNQVIQLNPNSLMAYHWQGLIYQELEKYQEALTVYNQEIKLDSLNFFSYFQRALVYTKLNRLIDALEDYNIAIKINNVFGQVYYNRAWIYYQLGDKQNAIEDYKKAIKIKPDLYQAYYNLGIIYQEFSDYQEAIKQYQLAIKLNSKYIQAHYNLAILQANLGLFKRAINSYEQVLQINPHFIEANYNKNSLNRLLENQGHIVMDSTQFLASLEPTPEIIRIDDQDNMSEEDEEKYGTLSGGRKSKNKQNKELSDDLWN